MATSLRASTSVLAVGDTISDFERLREHRWLHLPCDVSPSEARAVALRERPSWFLIASGSDDRLLVRVVLVLWDAVPRARLAVLGHPDDTERCERWLRLGATVYLATGANGARVHAAMIAASALGVVIVDACFAVAAHADRDFLQGPDRLTLREQEVLDHLRLGMRNKEIAVACSVSIHTVEFHLRNIYQKLGVSNRLEAVRRARRLAV